MPSVFEAYITDDEAVAGCFPAHPRSIFDTAANPASWDPALRDDVLQYSRQFGLNPTITGDEPVIITGQQPGIFAGSAYTVYKAMTAVKLAAQLTERHGRRYVPLFWLAGDDHDFDEAREVSVLTKRHEPLALRYEPTADVANVPMHSVPLEDSLHDLIDLAANETQGSEFRDEVAKFLHDSLEKSASLHDWTAHIIGRLFQHTDLALFAPHLPSSRKLCADIIAREIDVPLRSTQLANEAGRNLTDAGFEQQLAKNDNEVNFFIESDGRRHKVVYNDGNFVLPESNETYSPGDMKALLNDHPERFSPNVIIRPVAQQRLFPCQAYVAGPGEIAYWAQLKPVFAYFEQEMPVVYPRCRIALTDRKLRMLMDDHGIPLNDAGAPLQELEQRALHTVNRSNGAVTALESHRVEMLQSAEALSLVMDRLNPTARDQSHRLHRLMAREFDRIERTLLREDEERVETVRRHVQRIANTLAPARKPQERVYTICSFLFAHGFGLIDRIMDAVDVTSFDLQEVEL